MWPARPCRSRSDALSRLIEHDLGHCQKWSTMWVETWGWPSNIPQSTVAHLKPCKCSRSFQILSHNDMWLLQLSPMQFLGWLMIIFSWLVNLILYSQPIYISTMNRSNGNNNNTSSGISTTSFEHLTISDCSIFFSIINDNNWTIICWTKMVIVHNNSVCVIIKT